MKKILIILTLLYTQITFTQNYVHQVLILNEGYYDYTSSQIIEPVTIGSYDPSTQSYIQVAIIDSVRFASDLIIDNNYFYVAADNKILKYNLNDYSLVQEIILPGVRNLIIHNNYLYATRGEYMATYNSYLHVYDKSNLNFIYEFDTLNGPKWSTQNMIIENDKLYVAINNGFEWGNEQGLIGVIQLDNLSYVNEIDLGPDGKNPDNLFLNGNNLLTVNNKNWSGMSVSTIDINTNTTTTINLQSISTGCGTSTLRDGKINYQISGDTEIYEWDGIISSPIGMSTTFYTLSTDTINNYLYASSTDWVSFGEIFIYNNNNVLQSSFSCGVSPGTIKFDQRSISTINELENTFLLNNNTYDLLGRKINIENYNGLYIQNNKKYFKIKK
jgi:hypothetical protein